MWRFLILFGSLSSICFPASSFARPLTIRVMSQSGFSAKYNFSDPDRPGICIEIMRAIERVDPGVRFVGLEREGAYLRVEKEVEANRLDAYFGLVYTPERATRLRFLEEPVLYVHQNWLVVRADDNVQVKSFDDIRKLGPDGVVLTIHANFHSMYMKSQPGILVSDDAKGTEDNLRKLVAGRGRFYFGPEIALKDDMEKPGIQGKVKILRSMKFPVDRLLVAFSKKAPEAMVQRVKAALMKLKRSGELDRIYSKYAL